MSPANEERPSLYEFMPYGAPELMEVAKKYMFRATMGGIGTIAGIFVIMFVTNLIIAQQEKAIPVVQMQVSDLAAPPPLSPGYQAKTMASQCSCAQFKSTGLPAMTTSTSGLPSDFRCCKYSCCRPGKP